MVEITIRPHRLRQFGSGAGSTFCLVVNSDLLPHLQVDESGDYDEYRTVTFDPGDEFENVLAERIPQRSHVLVISPGCFFESPPPHLVGERKLMAMACNSTPTDLETIAHFMKVMEDTDPAQQEAFAERFFALAEASDHLEYVNEQTGTVMRFDHFSEDYEWNQQAGYVDWGEQQIVPAGEISVLPIQILNFDAKLSLALNGELTIHGYPILHNGRPSFTREDQARLHVDLAPMQEHPIVAKVTDGSITELVGTTPGARSAVEMLEAMFRVDSRYRLVWEIGHACNAALVIRDGNHAMNEVYGGPYGAVHWGLGLTPYTQFHLDIICPGTVLRGVDGEPLLGAAPTGRAPVGVG